MGKRLSSKILQELEDQVAAKTGNMESKVFGVCNMAREVIRRWRLTADGPISVEDEAEILIPERLEKLLFPKRRKIIFGGRGSAKTRTVTAILTERARIFPERVVCFREIQDSIADSSKQEIEDQIDRSGISEEFSITERKIRGRASGGTFTFSGLYRNLTKVKGKAGATVAWCEEAENNSRDSWDVLFPTIRAPGSEVWGTLNPREETDPTWSDIIAPYVDKMVDGIYEDDDVLIIECNFEHNPWLTKELMLERDTMARTDPDRYSWIWLGKFRRRSDVKVLNGKWIVEAFEPVKGWDGPYFGADFGFSQDPSTLNKLWIHNRRLYVEYEANGVGIELDDMFHFYAGEDGASDEQKEYLEELKAKGKKIHPGIPGARHYNIKADCARPETIAHIKKRQFRIEGAEKWPGSVEDGITFLRSFEQIIIHPRCKNTIFEANAYEYKTDRLTGDILPDIVDKHNHHWDAIRYALDKLIKRRGMSYYDY